MPVITDADLMEMKNIVEICTHQARQFNNSFDKYSEIANYIESKMEGMTELEMHEANERAEEFITMEALDILSEEIGKIISHFG